jgi:iron(III) transport system substrate-binding protein
MKPWIILIGAIVLAEGCSPAPTGPSVVVYAALDAEFSEPILRDFAADTGIAVLPKFDAESTKTVGLVQTIMAEAARPRCDVFWNNEILNTLRLERQGLLQEYRSPAAEEFPAQWRSRRGLWQGLAARARILLVNVDLVSEANRPTSIRDLADSRWRGRTGIAKPLFGTTATHAACLFAAWGDREARKYFLDLKANGVQIMAGNKQVAQAVAAGQLAFGLTDTDDALVEIDAGQPVAIVYPDQEDGGLGTLFIPNALAIVKGCPHPDQARRLVDYLLQPTVERRLAEGPSGQIPLNPAVQAKLRVQTPRNVRPMQVDFEAAADAWDTAATFVHEEFVAAE